MVALGLVTTEHLEGNEGDSGWSLVGGALNRSRSLQGAAGHGCVLSRCEAPRNPAPGNGVTVIRQPEKCLVLHIPWQWPCHVLVEDLSPL